MRRRQDGGSSQATDGRPQRRIQGRIRTETKASWMEECRRVKLESHVAVVDNTEGVFDSFRTAPANFGGAV